MKTLICAICIICLGIVTTFANLENKISEFIVTANELIIKEKQMNIESELDHKTHNDFVRINGKILCEKTQQFYRIK